MYRPDYHEVQLRAAEQAGWITEPNGRTICLRCGRSNNSSPIVTPTPAIIDGTCCRRAK